MKTLDRILQRWRISKTKPYIEQGARVLDIGCSKGELFKQLHDRIGCGVGVDDDLETAIRTENYELIPGHFPECKKIEKTFDVITMIAVLEHVPREHQSSMAKACAEHLKIGGLLIITTPAPLVDYILDGLKWMRLIDGMGLEEHFGFEPNETPGIFEPHGFKLLRTKTFQLGLNHLFVFQKAQP